MATKQKHMERSHKSYRANKQAMNEFFMGSFKKQMTAGFIGGRKKKAKKN